MRHTWKVGVLGLFLWALLMASSAVGQETASPTPETSPSPTAAPLTPLPDETMSPLASPSPAGDATDFPGLTPTPDASATVTPSPDATVTASPAPVATITPSPSPSPAASPAPAEPEQPKDERWFKTEKTNNLLGVIILSGSIAFFLFKARQGSNLFIRRIAGLQAVEEAVGRATEMGKPILFLTGLQDIDQPPTLAALSILGHVARKAAEYETPLINPNCRSLTMSTAQEVVREAHLAVGRPDSFNPDNVRYLTDDQFGFVAGVDGIMLRDRPAANFFMGYFYAESLILAETGHSTGAIQIAGTDATAQLPFFVAACDYTLIGEELYAASAYLSRDPQQVGSLKGQDMAKAIILFMIIASSIYTTIAALVGGNVNFMRDLFKT